MASFASTALPEFGFADFIKVMLLGLLLVMGQASLAAVLGLDGFGPECALVLAVYIALKADLWVAISGAFVLGCFRDAVGGWLWGWGLHPFTFVLLIWLFHPFRSRLNFFSPLTLVPLVFIICFGGFLFVMTPLMAILGWPGLGFNPLPAFISSSIITSFLAPLLFKVMEWLIRNTEKKGSSG